MPTRNVVLTDRHSRLIDDLVAAGRYQNASEAVREGVRLLEQREAENAAKLVALKAAVQVGLDDIAAGRYVAFDNFDDLATHLHEIAEEAIADVTREP